MTVTPPSLPERLRPDPSAASERVDAGLVVYRAHDRLLVELDQIGAAFWEALEASPTVDAALDRLLAEYEVERTVLATDLAAFAAPLCEVGLLTDGTETDDADRSPEQLLEDARDRYLDLMERHLLGLLSGSADLRSAATGRWSGLLDEQVEQMTLVGSARLRNVRELVEHVLDREVPGDLMECGVWRGGVGIMMRAVLAAHDVADRCVWLADSFAGLPEPDVERYPVDAFWSRSTGALAVGREQVTEHIRRSGLLDDRIRFLEGWFEDTLPDAPIEQLALLRIDGDLYESTSDVLRHLYDRVTPGGFVIVDDYAIESCRAAVDDFRAARAIDAPLHHIDWTGVFWEVT